MNWQFHNKQESLNKHSPNLFNWSKKICWSHVQYKITEKFISKFASKLFQEKVNFGRKSLIDWIFLQDTLSSSYLQTHQK